VRELYEQLATMGPSLVVMEDVDLVVGHRGQGGGRALLDFLVSLDGATSSHEGVVTIATTNDPGAIDPAAKRASRFDVLIEVPPPDVRGRREILARYLRDVPDHRIDIGVAARETPGLTGAELRELVSELVLRHAGDQSVEGGTPLDTAAFVRVAREHRREPPPGQYL